MRKHSLFKVRSPEVAALQLASALVWATECNMATLERLEGLKSSSGQAIERQRSIVSKMLAECHDLGVGSMGMHGKECGRVRGWLEAEDERLGIAYIRP